MIAKKISALLLSAIALFSASACTQQTASEPGSKIPVTGNVTITAFNVGKADALVVQTQNTVTVIDAKRSTISSSRILTRIMSAARPASSTA